MNVSLLTELLGRYWVPIAAVAELDDNPVKRLCAGHGVASAGGESSSSLPAVSFVTGTRTALAPADRPTLPRRGGGSLDASLASP